MKELLLSQFTSRQHIRLGFKMSKNVTKRIHIGTEVFESKHLSIIFNPLLMGLDYEMSTTKNGGLVLRQSTSGSLKFSITSDIKIPAYAEPPSEITKYIEVCFRDGNAYIPLE